MTDYALHDGIAVITLQHPPVNSLSHALRSFIVGALDAAEADPAVRGMVLVGNDKAFSAGADVAELGTPAQLAEPILLTVLARLAACRTLTYALAHTIDAGDGRLEASLVKLLACRSAETVTREALQLHGGMGYAEETDVSRYFVDARVLSIFEGAEETLALKVIARGLLEQALAGQAASPAQVRT